MVDDCSWHTPCADGFEATQTARVHRSVRCVDGPHTECAGYLVGYFASYYVGCYGRRQ
jgi:hypothetical protein